MNVNIVEMEKAAERLLKVKLMFVVQDRVAIDNAYNLLQMGASEIKSLETQVAWLQRELSSAK